VAIQDITKYTYKNISSLSVVQFDKACIMNVPKQVDAYSIYLIKKGSGIYHIDFENYSLESNTLFFLSPGQVFSVDSEAIEEAYKLTFLREANGEPKKGKQFNLDFEHDFINNQLEEFVRYEVKEVAVQGNNSFYTAVMELKLKDGSTLLSEQVVATQWKDGKIYRERYYHA